MAQTRKAGEQQSCCLNPLVRAGETTPPECGSELWGNGQTGDMLPALMGSAVPGKTDHSRQINGMSAGAWY